MYGVAWKYPSKARDAYQGFRHFLDSQQFSERSRAVARLRELEKDRDQDYSTGRERVRES